MGKLSLYFHTVRYMKPSQVYHRIQKMLKRKCTLGVQVSKPANWENLSPVASVEELDFDPVFLARFSAEELMGNRVTFLHESREFDWNTPWNFQDMTPLWNFNLHYFEYLFSLVKAYRASGNTAYLAKTKACIQGWIEQNPLSQGGPGWSPYTIALRLTNWLSYYGAAEKEINEDADFRTRFVGSIYQQYVYLSEHLEKDLLGNHYLEDLKSLILCAIFFKDEQFLCRVLREWKLQCKEQILPDGMHFELSPMYHKIIFEDVLRVAAALRGAGKPDRETEGCLQPVLNVAYSFEEGLERIPLFNDGGNNVAKSLGALLNAAKNHFGLSPQFLSQMPDSGYYIFRNDRWKLIVDSGKPGPEYIPGHAHCDAMSFELFKDGKPVIVNCGTYAYQCKERGFFRSTAAHNTVMADGTEQSQCWGLFGWGNGPGFGARQCAGTASKWRCLTRPGTGSNGQ